MNGSIRQRSPGFWEFTVDVERNPIGRHRRKYGTRFPVVPEVER